MPLTKARQAVAASGVSKLAQTIAIPHDYPPQRLPAFPNTERTATVGFMSTVTVSLPQTSSMRVGLVRSPTFPVWYDRFYGLNLNLSVAYTGLLLTTEVSESEGSLFYSFPSRLENSMALAARVITPDSFQAQDIPYGIAHNATWFYVPAFMVPGVVLEFSTGVSGSIEVVVEVIDDATSSFAPFQHSFLVDDSSDSPVWVGQGISNTHNRWMRPVSLKLNAPLNQTGVSISNFTFGWTTNGSILSPTPVLVPTSLFLPMESPPEFSTKLPYESVRSTATSLLLSNVTKVLNKEGVISGARFVTDRVPFFNFSETSISRINVRERYFGLLEKGVYAFTLPDASSEKFETYESPTESLKPFYFADHNYFVGLVLTDIDNSSTTTLAATLINHLEFRTDSELFKLGYYAGTLEEYHHAQMSLAKMGCIFENPVHLAAIKALVSKAISSFAPYVKPVVVAGIRSAGSAMLSSALSSLKPAFNQAGFTAPRPKSKPKASRKPKPKARRA